MNPPYSTLLDIDRRREMVAAFLAVAAVVVVGSAWGFEFAGFVPCKLCLMQRVPYYVAAPLAALAFGAERLAAPSWIARLLLLVLIGLFLYGGAVGFYQAGAEWAFWPGPTDCGATRGANIPASAGDLMASLAKVKIVDCTKAQIRILGLSFAGWNVLVSAGLVAVAIAGIVAPSRARRA